MGEEEHHGDAKYLCSYQEGVVENLNVLHLSPRNMDQA
jgi:hypothetical protein